MTVDEAVAQAAKRADEDLAFLKSVHASWLRKKQKAERTEMPDTQTITLVSAAPSRPGTVTIAMVVDGRQQTFAAEAHVAAALSADIVRALGSSLLYDAGLERAAQIAALRCTDEGLGTAEEELSAAALAIRECKIGRRT